MDTGPLRAVVRHLRRWAGPRDVAPSSDADLLTRFVTTRDQAGFAEIVQRHGPLVWAVCRSRLNAADADDAFQATFLVLARRAGNICKRASLACWLSGVARRAVRSLLTRQARRREVSLEAEHDAGRESPDIERLEWRTVLGEELDRLPEKYRLPTLLCYYQGLTNEEAARRLGWPHGTVCGRLARARELLRKRLTRRGVTLATGALVTGVTGPPTELIAATLRASAAANVQRTVLQLAEAVMTAMWISKAKAWTAGALAIAVLGGTAGAVVWGAGQAKGPPAKPPLATENQPHTSLAEAEKLAEGLPEPLRTIAQGRDLPKPEPGDDQMTMLLKERWRVAAKELEHRFDLFKAGSVRGGTISELIDAQKRLLEARLALSPNEIDQMRAQETMVIQARTVEAVSKSRFDAGQLLPQEYERSRYHRLDMEIKLLQAKAQAERDAGPKKGR